MVSTKVIAAVAAMGSLALVAAAPASSQISISLPTGSAAVTAAPAVPTFAVSGIETDVVDADAASGSASVLNNCGFEVYIYVCDQSSCGPIINVDPNGGTYSAPYSTDNDGISIKIGTVTGEVDKPILQLEYTPTSDLVYFDLSEVNGNPFGPYGFSLTDSAGMDQYCAPPGDECTWVFTTPTNGMVYADPISDSIGVTLCG